MCNPCATRRSSARTGTIHPVHWEPTDQEVEEKLTEMAYIWGDIEEKIEVEARDADNPISNEQFLSEAVGKAFRVEAVYDENDFSDPCSSYILLYDVADKGARSTVETLDRLGLRASLSRHIVKMARPWHNHHHLHVKLVPRSTPVEGQICRRVGQERPPTTTPLLEDIPLEKPESAVGLVERDGYWLTPIEAPFYDALRDTGLTFAVQPWIQGTDSRYRPDFLVLYGGQAAAVELDGHDWHKTKEQRSHDAKRDRWFKERRVETIRFTGSQVFKDAQGCVGELLNVLRGANARP